MRREFFILANVNETQRSSATLSGMSGRQKAEKELRGVKRYVNLFYRIYNGRRKHEILPMKF